MELVGPGFGHHIDNSTQHPARLDRVNMGFNLELLNLINDRRKIVTVTIGIIIVGSVHEEEVAAVGLAVYRRIGECANGMVHLRDVAMEFCATLMGLTPGVRSRICVKLRPLRGRSWTSVGDTTLPRVAVAGCTHGSLGLHGYGLDLLPGFSVKS